LRQRAPNDQLGAKGVYGRVQRFRPAARLTLVLVETVCRRLDLSAAELRPFRPFKVICALPDVGMPEARLRLAVQSFDRQTAADLIHEVETLYTNGPAGGGVETPLCESVVLLSALVPADLVTPHVEVLE
jgi:hypothetical protein